MLDVVRRIVLLAAGLFALGILVIVGNTIRLDIENRRDEIEVTKLVGGSNAFVRRPFLYNGFWYGLGGGLVAWLVVAAAIALLSEPVQRIAGLYGLQEGAKKAKPVILEPIMAMEVVTPESSMGDIIGDLSSRRGRITEMRPDKGGTQIVRAQVPLSEVFGYATAMRSMSQGRATYTMEPSHYEQVPSNVAEDIMAKGKK